MNDLRPVALTAVPMKILERFFLGHFQKMVKPYLDPLQFAYQAGRSCEDALLFLLDKLYSHLEGAKFGCSSRVLFFDFSSAFNTIQPHILIQKLIKMDIPANFSLWILDYLTNRTQFVKLDSTTLSLTQFSNTGSPQGTVLAPFFFTVYTSDCRSSCDMCPLIKFADDTILAGLIDRDNDYAFKRQLESFVEYCNKNFLELNVSKTKEMLIDFRKNTVAPDPVLIGGLQVERVPVYKYLGVMIDDKLTWNKQVEHIVKKLHPRLYCLRKLASFQVRPGILKIFYNSAICGVWRYCLTCWGGNVRRKDRAVLNDIIGRAERIMGQELESVDSVYRGLVGRGLDRVWNDIDHPLHNRLSGLKSLRGSGRLRLPSLKTNRYHDSFTPRAIRLFNERDRLP